MSGGVSLNSARRGSLSLDRIVKSFGDACVVDDVSLDIRAGEFLTLLGPSGCGKSTLLRIIAGLEPQTSGAVGIDGVSVDHLRPKQRDVAMVFQNYALYPHMTVAENIATPLRMRGMSLGQRLPMLGRFWPGAASARTTIRSSVDDIADALEIRSLLSRKPGQLSGGQRQRVAIGRALVRRPKIFLMDEPLSNLDAKLRVQLRAEIKAMHARLGITFIYVTHDQAEALTMSDRVAVMMDGRLLQVAPPKTIYASPNSLRVASFVGSPGINLLKGVARRGGVTIGETALDIAHGQPDGAEITVGVRPEALTLAEPGHDGNGAGALSGRLSSIDHFGSDLFLHLSRPDMAEPLIVRAAPETEIALEIGQTLYICPRPRQISLFDTAGDRIETADPVSSASALRIARA